MGVSLRFYLWAKSGPRRISMQMLDDIYDKRVAILQYAGTRQNMIEAVINNSDGRRTISSVSGQYFDFDSNGYLAGLDDKLRAAMEVLEVGWLASASHAGPKASNVVDIGPKLRRARYKRENQWQPTDHDIAAMIADVAGSSRLPG